MPISSRGEERRGEERRWRCGPEAKAGVDTCALRTEAAEEVCLNGNAQRVGYGGGGGRREGEGYRTVPLTIVRWWLCSLAGARSRAAKSHAYIEPWILSLPPPPPPPAFPPSRLSLFLSWFARYLLFAAMAMQTRWRRRAAGPVGCSVYRKSRRAAFKNGISLAFSRAPPSPRFEIASGIAAIESPPRRIS